MLGSAKIEINMNKIRETITDYLTLFQKICEGKL